jgi:excisionase family DNA binding protein
MNLKTAALRLGVHYQTAYRWVRSGQLVAVKVGAGYEISDAAVARLQAQRAATERVPERVETAPAFGIDDAGIDDALHLLDSMVDVVTLDVTAIGEHAARVAAENLGDTAFLYRRTANDDVVMVHAAHRDPVSEVAASTLGRDPRTSTNMVRRTLTTGAVACVSQVPQRELRRRLHPELHEHLQLSGCYSAVCVPIEDSGVLLVTRDLPGRPYSQDDVEFVESIAIRIARADERVRCWTGAWEMRRAMVVAYESAAPDSDCLGALLESVDTDQPIVALLDPELRHVACSKAYGALVGEDASQIAGMSLRSLVRDGGALDEALAPVLMGEIDFRSVELEVLADEARVALHLAMVRREDATPRGAVVVAHSVPALSGG